MRQTWLQPFITMFALQYALLDQDGGFPLLWRISVPCNSMARLSAPTWYPNEPTGSCKIHFPSEEQPEYTLVPGIGQVFEMVG
jgi:hypothetical protein